MPRPRWIRTRDVLAVALGVAALGGLGSTPAHAADDAPCAPLEYVSWSAEPVQLCPLTAPLAPNNWVPVYARPVPNPRGATPPAPAGWLHGTANQRFVCEQSFVNDAVYYHPNGWRNYYWAYTLSDDGVWGWVPEVFFRGGVDDEPDGGSVPRGLRGCEGAEPAPAPAPQPTPPPALPGTPAGPCDVTSSPSGVRVRASFGQAGPTVTARYGRRLRVTGTARGPDGAPLANATLCVGAIDPDAGAMRPTGTVVTDDQGRFVYRLERGPSRRIWFVHRAATGAASDSVYVRVRARVMLKPSRRSLRNGQSVVLRGRLGGGSRAYKVFVEIQARRATGWQTFGSTRADRRGRFSYRYQFTRTLGVQRYALRARVLGQRGYPFATGASRPVRLLVKG